MDICIHNVINFSIWFLQLATRVLTHWGRVTHICVGKLTTISSDNGLSPERHQAIIRTNAGILLIGPMRTNFIELLIEIQSFSLKKIRLKMSSAKCCSFRLGLNMLTPALEDWSADSAYKTPGIFQHYDKHRVKHVFVLVHLDFSDHQNKCHILSVTFFQIPCRIVADVIKNRHCNII